MKAVQQVSELTSSSYDVLKDVVTIRRRLDITRRSRRPGHRHASWDWRRAVELRTACRSEW